MARDFLPQIDERARPDFERVVDIGDFWTHWSTLINRYKTDGTFSNWLHWRTKRIEETFQQRLHDLDVKPDLIPQATANFKNNSSPFPGPAVQQSAAQFGVSGEGTRTLIHRVVDKIAEEDLRRIWLPAGLLIDELVIAKGNS
jgi:hypothetical protein